MTDDRLMPDAPQPLRPPWASNSDPVPDPDLYVESEQFVAGALSTIPPFSSHHPAWCLPYARRALEALSEWEPSE